jgi:serine kinase of HPr protein (carbohydrate metabolism regulator)
VASNLHATAVILGDRGILIAGDTSTGKTTLALSLIEHFTSAGQFARLVSDDQVFISARNGRLVCEAPPPIAGLAEVRSLGPRPLSFEPRMVADLVTRLLAAEAPRFSEDATETIMGCNLPRLDLPARNARRAVLAIASRLSVAPFR